MRSRLTGLAVGVLAAGLGLGLLSASGAQAAGHPHTTTVCGNSSPRCTSISSLLLNQGNGPDFVQNATGLGAVGGTDQGRKVNLRQASDTRVNEDFIVDFVGTVGQLCELHGVNSLDPTSYACLVYDFNGGSNYPVYQAQFAPDSNESGFCAGALAATQGFKIRLEPCGSPRSLWVADLAAQITVTVPGPHQPLFYFPLEFAADTSASNPLVLTLNTNTKNPADGLFIQRENFSGGNVADSQMFTLTDQVGFTFP